MFYVIKSILQTGSIRDTRDSAYGAPEAPASSYGAPAVAYEEPAPAYGAPAEPAPAYGAPEEPAPAYGAPAYEAEDVFNTMLYGSEDKLPLLIQNSLIINKNYDTTIDTFWDIKFDFHNDLVKDQIK